MFAADPRDTPLDPDEVNAGVHYVQYAVFGLPTLLDAAQSDAAQSDAAPIDAAPIDAAPVDAEAVEAAVAGAGVTVRGWYDISGFRADADLLVWMLADDPQALQRAYAALRRSSLGERLVPRWSNIGVHRPAEFNNAHTPACFSGIAPRPWLCVYPFVRSYEWYYLEPAKRSHMLRTHGMAARDFPDVLGSTTSAFALGDYEWLLAFEADELHRLTDAMRAQRAVEARLHVREETPFFTGPRVALSAWIANHAHAAP